MTSSAETAGEAAECLASARLLSAALHEPGQREIYRERLDRAIALAEGVVACTGSNSARESARATLVHALAARADDALHGANQLSLSAQRAPTAEACDDGWRQVESIVARAEDAARIAAQCAAEIETESSRTSLARRAISAAERAATAARAARRIVDERNHAFTFHTDHGFSFGEGWHLAAAAALAGIAIQIESDKPGTAQAERFLRDAGLGAHLQGYRPRPRAAKQTSDIVARAFRADPAAATQRLRAAFLGDEPIAPAVAAWAAAKMAGAGGEKTVLLWVRDGVHHAGRNTSASELAELARRARAAGLAPVVIGDAVRGGELPHGVVDMTRFSRDPVFQHEGTRRAQLQLFECLRITHGLVGQLGVTTAGMDGPALMGLPTMYLTDVPNVRMGAWAGAVPGYREIVRTEDFLARIESVLRNWCRGARHGE